MSIECSECERDLRGGHDPECSRHPKKKEKKVPEKPAKPPRKTIGERKPSIELAADDGGEWHWILWSANGRPIASNPIGYHSQNDCISAIRGFLKMVKGSELNVFVKNRAQQPDTPLQEAGTRVPDVGTRNRKNVRSEPDSGVANTEAGDCQGEKDDQAGATPIG